VVDHCVTSLPSELNVTLIDECLGQKDCEILTATCYLQLHADDFC